MGRLIWLVALALLGACGGSEPEPQAEAQINGTNYLDAYAVSAAGLSRVGIVARIVDHAFALGLQSEAGPAAPGAVPCAGSGAFAWQDDVFDGRNVTVAHPCESDAVQVDSGSLNVSPNGYVLDNVAYRKRADPITESVGGSVLVQLAASNGVRTQGRFVVARNGRADVCQKIDLTSRPATAGSPLTASGGSLEITSARFAKSPLRVSVADGGSTLVVVASDKSRVVVTELSNGAMAAKAFEVFAADAALPIVKQTLMSDDPLLLAAMARALE